ncbi:MAG: MFS transporter [Actinobacteria bacterium]|nr:MAG: MFS transporter [Actinomycetota bacterium]
MPEDPHAPAPPDTPSHDVPDRIDAPTASADAEAIPTGIRRAEHAAGITTLASFAERDFRWFWTGAFLSNVGTWMQTAALGWLVFALTNDELALGLVNFASGVPVFLFILFAGAAADRLDRRKLLIWMQWPMLLQALALGVLTTTGHVTMAWVYALSVFGGIFTAFMFPAWQAAIPDLVPKRLLLNAISLNAAQFNGARFVGPLIAGWVFLLFAKDASAGSAAVFYTNAASFLAVIGALSVIRPCQTERPHDEGGVLQRLGAGIRYAWSTPVVRVLLVTQAFLTLFGMPITALLPSLAKETLGQGQVGYSVLLACSGAGALTGALLMASLKPTVRRERIIVTAVPALGLLTLGIALSRTVWATGVLLYVAGIAFLSAVSTVNTSLQSTVPPQLRGRVMSLFVLSFIGIMPFGALAFGALGRAQGTPFALGAGAAVLTLYGAALALRPRAVATAA